MPEKLTPAILPEGWPDGTKIKMSGDKKEIILPKPTNMKEFESARLAKLAGEEKRKMGEYGYTQHSPNIGLDTMEKKDDFGSEKRAQKIYHSRQNEIKNNRSDEREFADRQDMAA